MPILLRSALLKTHFAEQWNRIAWVGSRIEVHQKIDQSVAIKFTICQIQIEHGA
jgi:hypothetical protein